MADTDDFPEPDFGDFPEPDFDSVAEEHEQQRRAVEAMARQGDIPADIAAARTAPDAGEWLLFNGFEVVADLALLCGPAEGPLDVPAHLADRELPEHIAEPTAWQRASLYRRLLLEGTAAEQARLLNRAQLRRLWPSRLGPPQILKVWEERFPELRATATDG
ncbi:hypothetical protein ACFOSC_29660 [Streptantibioticus rubrisoli]|uniref:Uncharacterized protein n=1 Tax=Streptantibioticus rubrisoli TaxID=1387313 RepID=A0ABT1PFZ1_9ACTN|nr:hypothetical protein [Streptantibioticus rubrisoli]MCQ4044286.1 hypothetical protein [Streptantibioticus rubrisoli]